MKRVAVSVLVVTLAVGAALLEPWRLFTDSTVDEAPPTSANPNPRISVDPETSPTTPSSSAPPQDMVLAMGDFEDAEHSTTGTAAVLVLADGRRYVRIENLATSDGPDLHVWLTDQPSGGDWSSYDDSRYVRLGELKANNGNQNYRIPDDTRLDGLRSVVIWCDRFNVAFGTAPVETHTPLSFDRS